MWSSSWTLGYRTSVSVKTGRVYHLKGLSLPDYMLAGLLGALLSARPYPWPASLVQQESCQTSLVGSPSILDTKPNSS